MPRDSTVETDASPQEQLGTFLRTRRAKLHPGDIGLGEGTRHRRVPGLRREELAPLAGVSVAYYIRMEQGRAGRISDEVIEAIARALRLNPAERSHLRNLAHTVRRTRAWGSPNSSSLRSRSNEINALLSTMRGAAYVVGPRADILAWNSAALALFGAWGDLPAEQRNWGRFLFETPGYRDLFVNWRGKAFDYVGYLRAYAGRNPNDPELRRLVEDLSRASDTFLEMWRSQDVKDPDHGFKTLRHPVVGTVELWFENLALPSDPELFLVSFHAEPGSEDETRFHRIISSQELPESARTHTA